MLNEINLRRAGTGYISEEDAIFVKGTKNKHPLTQEDLPFLILMLIGVNNKGYWTSSCTAIQIEDLADVLKVYRPDLEFYFLSTQKISDNVIGYIANKDVIVY